MAITKPSWLRTWLSRLNWDVFTWKVYIGDAIEEAIDWLLGWVNWGIDQANRAYNQAWDAYYKAVAIAGDLTGLIYREINDVLSLVNTWWSDLGDWWSARAQDVKYWIDVAGDFLQYQINSLGRSLDGLRIAWEGFLRGTLPGLLSMDRWTAFWGGAWQSIGDWWGARLDQVKDLLSTATDPITDQVNKLTAVVDMIKEFIDDPLSYILGKLIKITRAYRDLLLKLFDKVMDALWG